MKKEQETLILELTTQRPLRMCIRFFCAIPFTDTEYLFMFLKKNK